MFFLLLLGLMAMDIITGTLKAFRNKTLNSKLSRDGMIKKVSIILLLLTCGLFQPVFEKILGRTDIKLVEWLPLLFCVSEFISVLENVRACGVPLPKYLVDVLENARINLESSKKLGVVTIVSPPAQAEVTIKPAPVPNQDNPPPPPPATDDPPTNGAWFSG